MPEFLTLRPVSEILEEISLLSPLEAEEVPLLEALGRVTAKALVAPEDVPGFDRSTVDGFAVRARDVFGASEMNPALLEYAGECPMGDRPDITLDPGRTARIWTGGMLPEGADAVVMLEYSREAGPGRIELAKPAAPGDNIIRKGDDCREGQTLIPAGRRLRPQELGLYAALGREEISVRRRPKAAIISSGDEVVPVHETPGPGKVRDINTYTLAALVQAEGGVAVPLGIAGDSLDVLRAKVEEALEFADVVLLSGGSSAGVRDFTIAVLGGVPGTRILAHGVAMSPGKPLILAKQGNVSMWGLPGHAAGALVCAEVFIRPLLRRLSGMEGDPPAWQGTVQAELTRSVASAQGRRDYIRVALGESEGGGFTARPVLGRSGLISTLVAADGLAVCPENAEGLSGGQAVPVRLLV